MCQFIDTFWVCLAESGPQSKVVEPVKTAAPMAVMETVMVEDLLLPPGRYGRPLNIVVIIRGLPGCGKSHLTRLIKVLPIFIFRFGFFQLHDEFMIYVSTTNCKLFFFRKSYSN